MDLEAPETWRILWVTAAAGFVAAEMVRRLRLWFLPFAIGSGVAALAAWAAVAVPVQGLLFLAVSMVALFALRPLSRMLALSSPRATVGSHRWVGQQARVVTAVPVHGDGWVILGRERWRAQSGIGVPIPAGSAVLVTAVDGTHLTVLPLDSAEPYPMTSGQQPDQGA